MSTSHVEPEDIWPHPPVRAKVTDGVLTDLSPTKAKAKAAEEKVFFRPTPLDFRQVVQHVHLINAYIKPPSGWRPQK